MTKEETFFDALCDVFVGAAVEGESGYVNLMRIKATYYERGVFPRLQQDIAEALKPFPEFREELFDRLYTFFHRYFSESGSIYFRYTPLHERVYEQVYADDRDVALFWKTHMLYYVKTDRLFRSMTVEIPPAPLIKGGEGIPPVLTKGGEGIPPALIKGGEGIPPVLTKGGEGGIVKRGIRFFFDVSALEHKRSNEKRELVYGFKERRSDGALVLSVAYSERGRQTKIDDIRRALRREEVNLDEETLERAFRLFERQSEVDYFINKNARAFLREQFDLWLYQYVFKGETEWTERRIKQLQALKDIAYKIVDFIAQFEDELVRIWNKPKFVLGSHYVITLDRIASREGGKALLERVLAHPGMTAQVQEWRDLGMVGEGFRAEEILSPQCEGDELGPESEDAEGSGNNRFALDLFGIADERGLVTTGYHLPYDPKLNQRARELRANMTPAERRLWDSLLRRFPHRVLRQRPIDHYIVDFYCPALKLVIEVDGEQHLTEEGKAYDGERTRVLEGYGLRVVRVANQDVLGDFESVRARLEAFLANAGGSPETPSALSAPGAEGSPYSPNPLSPLSKGGEGARGSGGISSRYSQAGASAPSNVEGARGSGGINPHYQYLPLDTRHFKDLELSILGLFDHLDDALDGWLIKSENYQALNTLLPKFRERVKCIYIDPPYNTGGDEFIYRDRFRHSSWLTMMENRLALARELLDGDGLLFASIDENEVYRLEALFSDLLAEMVGTVIVQNNPKGRSQDRYFSTSHEYLLVSARQQTRIEGLPKSEDQLRDYDCEDENGKYRLLELRNTHRQFNRETRPNLWFPLYVSPDNGTVSVEPAPGHIEVHPIWDDGLEGCWTWGVAKVREEIGLLTGRKVSERWKVYRKDYATRGGSSATFIPKTIWDEGELRTDHAQRILDNLFGKRLYQSPKSPMLIQRASELSSARGDVTLDFFAGSGTTAHAVINLNRQDGGRRKYILVEMADYFDTVLLPRVKKVVFSDKWKDGKAQNGQGIGHFVKYFRLEQYEETLRRAHYQDDTPLFVQADPYTQYVFLRDTKMLDDARTGQPVVELDVDSERVRVDLSRLYESIDLAETLSCVTGKPIRRIHPRSDDPSQPGEVEFEDGERVSLVDPPWERVKPLVWW